MDAAAQLLSLGDALGSAGLLAQSAASGSDALAAVPLIHPTLILAVCVVAGIGTALLLPGNKPRTVRVLGGLVALVAGLVFFGWLARSAHQHLLGPAGLYFYAFALIAVVSAIRVITHTRPVYSALYFVLTVFATAGLFVLMHADFMAAALVIIYAGAILVTYVFVIMLASEAAPTASGTGAETVLGIDQTSRDPWLAAALGFALMGVLLYAVFDKAEHLTLRDTNGSAMTRPASTPITGTIEGEADVVTYSPAKPRANGVAYENDSVQALGTYLFDRQVLNLLLAGLLLTVAMIGAIMIARRKVVSEGLTFDSTEVVNTPATPTDDNPHSIPVYGTDNPRAKEYPQL